MTEEEKMMLRRIIVKEDELEELQMRLDRVQHLARCGAEFLMQAVLLASEVERLSREVDELREKLKEICGE